MVSEFGDALDLTLPDGTPCRNRDTPCRYRVLGTPARAQGAQCKVVQRPGPASAGDGVSVVRNDGRDARRRLGVLGTARRETGRLMEVRVWGCRGSVAAPGPDTVRYGGNTSCVEVRLESGHALVLDAGTGMRPLGVAMQRDPPTELHILLTHLHLDHLQGLGFFRPLFQPDLEVHLWGPSSPVRESRTTYRDVSVAAVVSGAPRRRALESHVPRRARDAR